MLHFDIFKKKKKKTFFIVKHFFFPISNQPKFNQMQEGLTLQNQMKH